MVAILVLSILLTVGVPSLRDDVIRNPRITSQTNATIGMLSFARSEAAKRPNVTITLCASSSTNSASPACDTNNWEEGWIVFSDLNADQRLDNIEEDLNGNLVLDPGEDLNGNGLLDSATDDLLRIGEPLSGDNTLRTTGFPNLGFIQFDSSAAPGSSGTFVLCDVRGATSAKAIIMSVIGHIRTAIDETPTDGTVNNHLGVNVTCPTS